MVEIDRVIDDKPAKVLIKELAALRIRNLQAFSELKALNNDGKFKYKHPLIKHYSLRRQLEDLFQRNPDEFLDEFTRVRDNVKRYASQLNKKNRSGKEKERDAKNLQKYQDRERLMKSIVKDQS